MSQQLPDISFFHQLANAASKETLSRYRADDLSVESKPKAGFRFDPVTAADRAAETVMRALIGQHFPEHAIMGEEFGTTGGGPLTWVLDPIDGTRPYLCGLPVWGTLIGLLENERAVMGMMSQPYTGERFWSDGKQSWASSIHGHQLLQTRKNLSLDQAILHTTAPKPTGMHDEIQFAQLAEQTLMTRYGGECYAMAMLAAGRIDICVEFSLQPYDIVAMIPLIEQAGGVVTTLDGQRAEKGGAVVASGCPKLHQQVLDRLNGQY